MVIHAHIDRGHRAADFQRHRIIAGRVDEGREYAAVRRAAVRIGDELLAPFDREDGNLVVRGQQGHAEPAIEGTAVDESLRHVE